MRRSLQLDLADNVIGGAQALPGSASEDSFKTHIERLACLIGRGVAAPSTVPAEEIEQARSLLIRIGIAVPKTARAERHIAEMNQRSGSPSKVRITRAPLSQREVRV